MTIANVEMAKAWDGVEGDRWDEHADRYEATGRRHAQRLLAVAPIGAADHVLDIGCGTGRSTRDAARRASTGSALGVDLSAKMLARARELSAAEGLANVRFEQADAQVHPFDEGAFDLVISSFGAMFFADPVAAFGNIARAVRPGGRLAMLAWTDLARNEWVSAIRDALAFGRALPEPPVGAPGPFGLADRDRNREILGSAGFADIEHALVDEPAEFGRDAGDAFAFVRTLGIVHGLTADLDDQARQRALDDLYAVLAAHETADGVLLGTEAWLITARRR